MTNKRKTRPRNPALSAIQQNIAGILGESHYEQLAALSRLRRAWPDIVGPMMAQRTEPTHFDIGEQGNTLWVAVYHSTVAQQIRFLRDDIRKACSKQCNLHHIVKVRTRVQTGAGIQLPKIKQAPVPLSFSQCKAVASLLHSVEDKGLRRAMFQARIAQIRYETQLSRS